MHVLDGAGGIRDVGEDQRRETMRKFRLVDDLDRFKIVVRPDLLSGFAVDAHLSLSFARET